MTPRRWYFLSLFFSAVLVLLAGALIFIIDPLAHYRYPSFYKPGFIAQERFLAPGIARNFTYDCPVLGDSILENFIPSYLDNKMAVNSIRLLLPSGSSYELGKLLDIVIKTGRAKKIIYELDVDSFLGEVDRKHKIWELPLYLYDDNPFNDLPYLLNISYLTVLVPKVMLANLFNTNELSKNTAYRDNRALYSRKKIIAKFLQVQRSDPNLDVETSTLEKMKKSFAVNLLSKIEGDRNTAYIIYFPPTSILAWKYAEHKGVLESYLRFKKYVFAKTSQLGNVQIYDFQDDEKITHNLDNYADLTHYSSDIDKLIINAMASRDNRYLLTENTVEERLDNLRRQVVRLDISQLE